MTTITIDRAVVEQALEALEHHGGNLPWNAFVEVRKDLRDALAQQAEPAQDQDVEDAIEAAYWQFDCRKKGLNEWASAPQSERDAFKAEARKLVRGYFPTRQAQDTKREMLAVADAFIRGKRAAPPQRKPLTEKEMYIVEEEARKNFRLAQAGPRGQMITYWDSLTPWLIRAVERAHGIKE